MAAEQPIRPVKVDDVTDVNVQIIGTIFNECRIVVKVEVRDPVSNEVIQRAEDVVKTRDDGLLGSLVAVSTYLSVVAEKTALAWLVRNAAIKEGNEERAADAAGIKGAGGAAPDLNEEVITG